MTAPMTSREALELIDYALNKDSLTYAERVDDARQIVKKALAALPDLAQTAPDEASAAAIARIRSSVLDDDSADLTDADPMEDIRILLAEYDRVIGSPVSSTDKAPLDLCAGGVDPGWDACPKCGATMDDECAHSSKVLGSDA